MKKVLIIVLFQFIWMNVSISQFEQFEQLEESTSSDFWGSYFKNFFKLSNYVDLSSPYGVDANFNADTRFYNANGIDPQQSPLFWSVNGNVNARIYEFNIPISFLLATDKVTITKPQGPQLPDFREDIENRFTRIGASPNYKWAKLHLGHRTMDFSEYVMSSLPFFGVGTELNPGKFRFGFFRGSLADAKPRDLSLLEPNLPIFSRKGWGTKFGYGDESNSIDFMLFNASDDQNSIPVTDDFPISPAGNSVYSISARKTIWKFAIFADIAKSATTTNILDDTNGSIGFPFSLTLDGMTPSTEKGTVVALGTDFTAAAFVLGVNYKRISDGYNSLGIPFLNKDIEEISGNFSSQLLKGALQYNLSLGVQRDNVSGLKDQTINRLIYAVNTSYSNGAFTAGANFSNNSFQTDYLLSNDLDSLDVVVVTRNGGLNLGYSINSESNWGHSFQLASAVSDITDDLDFSMAESRMYNNTFTYGISSPNKWNFNFTLGHNLTDAPTNEFTRWMYGLGARKAFFDNKLDFNLQSNFFTVAIDQGGNQVSNNALNGIAQLTWKASDLHSFYTRFNLIQKGASLNNTNERSTETIANVGYRFNISYSKQLKENKESNEQ